MQLNNLNFKIRWQADSPYELGRKLRLNYDYLRRWFGTGIISGGVPTLKVRDFTDSITVEDYFVVDKLKKNLSAFRSEPFPVHDATIFRFNVIAGTTTRDTTVNCWIEGSKVEFFDGTILFENFRVFYDTTDDPDINIPTRSVTFTGPILAFINRMPFTYDSTTEHVLRHSDGTRWIALDRDGNWWETKKPLDSTNYLTLWAVKFGRIYKAPEGRPKRLKTVRDMRNVIPNALENFQKLNVKSPVPSPGDLPIAGSEDGDLRFTTESYKRYLWVYDTNLTGSVTNNYWNPIEFSQGLVAERAFYRLLWKTQNKNPAIDYRRAFYVFGDSSAAEVILNDGQHITLTPDAARDRITVDFIVDRNLDFNGLSTGLENDPGRTNWLINIKDIDTTNMSIDGSINVDGTVYFGGLVDIKNILTIFHSAQLLEDGGTIYVDMTHADIIIDGGQMEIGSHLNLVGDISANNINVNRRGNPPDNHYGLVEGIDVTAHASRHEDGGVDEVNVTSLKGVSRGQNAGWLQDETVSNAAPIVDDVLVWKSNYWTPTSRAGEGGDLLRQIALWNNRKVNFKRNSDNLAFLEKSQSFRDEQGNQLFGAWECINEKDIYARHNVKGAFSTYINAFRGSTFDGNYIYLAPYNSNFFVKFDSRFGFDQTASYESMRTTRVQADATGGTRWFGCVFDGKYITYIPNNNNTCVRYRMGHTFTDLTAWETIDIGSILTEDISTVEYAGGIFDGHYIYFVPLTAASLLRYDVSMPFSDSSAWQFGAAKSGFLGGTYDGQYIYFAPYDQADFVRFLPEDYTDIGDWHHIDATKVLRMSLTSQEQQPLDNLFAGATFDGRYVYYCPYDSTAFVRVDTIKAFNALDSWDVAELREVIPPISGIKDWKLNKSHKWFGCRFDGRYIYYSPYDSPIFVQYDTVNNFTASPAWDRINFSVGDGVVMSQGYNAVTHRYVELDNPTVLGTDRVLISSSSGGASHSYYIYHVLWNQENVNRFEVSSATAQSFLDINRGNAHDTTFSDCYIKCAALDRDGLRMWVFTSHDKRNTHDFIYEMDLNGNVLSRGRIGTGTSNDFNYIYCDTDQVYGHIYVTTQGGVDGISATMRTARLSHTRETAPNNRLVSILTNATVNGSSPIGSAKYWKPDDDEWESFIYFQGIWTGDDDVDIFTVSENGNLTHKKKFVLNSVNVGIGTQDYQLGFHGGVAITDDGLFVGVHTPVGPADPEEGTFYLWDSTNWDEPLGVSGYARPKLIRWSGYLSTDYSGTFNNVVWPTDGLEGAFGSNWSFKTKIAPTISRDNDWFYVNLWDAASRVGRINLTFTAAEEHLGTAYIQNFGGCEVDGKYVYYIPGTGNTAMKFTKPFKVNMKSKLGQRGSP